MYRIQYMSEKEIIWGQERGKHLLTVSDVAAKMVVNRIGLEERDQKLITPLCSEELAVHIEELVPRAKVGYALALKADRLKTGELMDFLTTTTPLTTSGIWRELTLSDRHNTLPEYWHVIASLALLLKIGRVSFSDFASPPSGIGYELGKTDTYWYCSETGAGEIWGILDELESGIRASLYHQKPLGKEKLLKIGHFFSAGKEIAGIFMD